MRTSYWQITYYRDDYAIRWRLYLGELVVQSLISVRLYTLSDTTTMAITTQMPEDLITYAVVDSSPLRQVSSKKS